MRDSNRDTALWIFNGAISENDLPTTDELQSESHGLYRVLGLVGGRVECSHCGYRKNWKHRANEE
jgi:hypothetical protein